MLSNKILTDTMCRYMPPEYVLTRINPYSQMRLNRSTVEAVNLERVTFGIAFSIRRKSGGGVSVPVSKIISGRAWDGEIEENFGRLTYFCHERAPTIFQGRRSTLIKDLQKFFFCSSLFLESSMIYSLSFIGLSLTA